MERYSGFKETGYKDEILRYEVLVPVSVLEDRITIINAYRGKRRIASVEVPLRSLPHWNSSLQTLILIGRDQIDLERATDKLVKKLSRSFTR